MTTILNEDRLATGYLDFFRFVIIANKQEIVRLKTAIGQIIPRGLEFQPIKYFPSKFGRAQRKYLVSIDDRDYMLWSLWWSWRESNPRPNIFVKSFLHAYSVLLFREATGNKQPITSLAEWSYAISTAYDCSILFCFESAAGRGNKRTCPAALMTT